MKKALIVVLLAVWARPVLAQTAPEGIWQGYDGEWKHVSRQLLDLAEATPADKFSWRPAPGVRSTSEVYMHIALANFYLLSVTGPKMPADMKEGMDKSVTAKADVIAWLNGRSTPSRKRMLESAPRISNAKFTSPIVMPPSMACISASSFTPMSTWASSSPTPA